MKLRRTACLCLLMAACRPPEIDSAIDGDRPTRRRVDPAGDFPTPFGAIRPVMALPDGRLLVSDLGPGRHSLRGPVCRPVDSAWAVAVELTDSVTHRPVGSVNVGVDLMAGTVSDSTGFACLRVLVHDTATVSLWRAGYRRQIFVLASPSCES